MKQLTLIRHAKPRQTNGIPDIDRPLNHRGERDAPRMATHLQALGFAPGVILSSPATRAATTAETIARGIAYDVNAIIWKDQIYAATPNELRELIGTLDPDHTTAAIVGHNPSLTELANHLQRTHVANIPTCGVVTIQFDVNTWPDTLHTPGTLTQFDTPQALG